ncbi:hypothetical protein [Bdellovibrio sp. HCB274]|uniref:hypothetical protein n=1 Tax=Bdellovibrio sp. HCB274 TaxID=3394361 RepID=UPI0039B58BB2
MQVLTAMVVMSISFYFLSSYVIGQRKQVVKTKNVVNLKFAVNSALDYVVFGVRQKYCFDNVTLMQNTTSCDWNHAGNVERLVMSDEQLQSLQAMATSGTNIGPHDKDLEKLRLDKIELNLVFPVSANHPLFPVVNNLKNVVDEVSGAVIPVKSIKVVLTRPPNAGYLPKAGREVYIQAQVSLVDKSDKVIQVGRAPLQVRAQLAIYPREVGSFALILPGNLRMDKDWNASQSEIGDVVFHRFNNKAELKNSTGLVFKSPVFVNGNIHLPFDTGAGGNSNYAGVTFADRVYMGNGWILRPDNRPFAPSTQGASADRFWSDSRVFGGFLSGIENDGMRDLGLDVMSGRSSGSNGEEYDWNKICSDLNQKSSKLEYMEASDLKATKKESTDPTKEGEGYYTNYRLVLTNYNTFYAQKNQLPTNPTLTGDWSTGKWTIDNKDRWSGAVAKVEILYGSGADERKFSMDLVKDGYVEVKPPVLNPARLTSIKNSLDQAKLDLKNAQDTSDSQSSSLSTLKTQRSTTESELKTAKDNLLVEKNKPVEPVPTPSPSPSPSVSPTVSPSPTESPDPEATPGPTPETTPESSPEPTPVMTVSPSPSPSPTPVPPGTYQDPAEIERLEKLVTSLSDKLSDLNKQINNLETKDMPATTKAKDTAQANVTKYQGQLDAYEDLKDHPPIIKVDLDPAYSWTGKEYKDRLDVQVTITNGQYLVNKDGQRINNLSVRFRGYDGTYYNSVPIRSSADPDHLSGYLNFLIASNGNVTRPTALSLTSGTGSGTDDDTSADLAAKCEEYYNMINSQSFGAANWGSSFSSSTRKSWNFAGEDGAVTADPVAANRTWAADDEKFMVRSIIKDCVIKAGASFVTGFYTCDNLVIEGGRTKPLRIVGTFIIGKSLQINEQAIRTGITWTSIYYPQATQELRARGILFPLSDPANKTKCDNLPSPIWHPMPSIQETADRMNCNVISLRAKADPFKWTAVDPDCGIPIGATQTVPTCKRRIYHYYVVEQAREGQGL